MTIIFVKLKEIQQSLAKQKALIENATCNPFVAYINIMNNAPSLNAIKIPLFYSSSNFYTNHEDHKN